MGVLGARLCPCMGQGGYKHLQGPRVQGWGSAGSGVPLASPRSTDASSNMGREDALSSP